MTGKLLTEEFLDELAQRADRSFSGKLHQAFVDWYVEAEFGRVQWHFTDDVSDGGIDAVVWRPGEVPPVVLIQSKFSENVDSSLLAVKAYTEFAAAVEAFHFREDTFDEFLGRVRTDLRPVYRKAFESLTELGNWAQEKKAFRLITTHRGRPKSESPRLNAESYTYADGVFRLYSQYRKGTTPTARPLQLRIADKIAYDDPNNGISAYLFNAHLSDFHKYLEVNDVARLVARNIRYNLGGRVGHRIRHTYEKRPSDFWYFHNGLTIVCDDMTEKAGIATLINPSVVNGAQTLYAISGSMIKNSKAMVTARVIVRGDGRTGAIEDDEWLQHVIRGVNTQNRVKAADFYSNEPEQVELSRLFRDMRVFYERKRGEWKEHRNESRYKNFDRLTMEELGYILTIANDDSDDGVLLVKRGTERVFEEKHYRQLFPSKAKVAKRFKRIYLAYRIYRLLNKYGYKSSLAWAKQRHGFWNTFWLLHRGMTNVDRLSARTNVERIREAFDRLETTGATAKMARRSILKLVREVWKVWQITSKSDRARWTPNNFFKAKTGNKTIEKLAFPKLVGDLAELGEHIVD